MKRKTKGPRFPDEKYGKDKTVGYAYVGRYNTGDLGWAMPMFLSAYKDRADAHHIRENDDLMRPSEFYLCRITVEIVPGARKIYLRKRRAARGDDGKEE